MGGCLTLPKLEAEWQVSMYPVPIFVDSHADSGQALVPIEQRNKYRDGCRELIERDGAFEDVVDEDREEVVENYRESIVIIFKNSHKLNNSYMKMAPDFQKKKSNEDNIYLLEWAVKHISSNYESFFRASNFNIDGNVKNRKDIGRNGYHAIEQLTNAIDKLKTEHPPNLMEVEKHIKEALDIAHDLAADFDNTMRRTQGGGSQQPSILECLKKELLEKPVFPHRKAPKREDTSKDSFGNEFDQNCYGKWNGTAKYASGEKRMATIQFGHHRPIRGYQSAYSRRMREIMNFQERHSHTSKKACVYLEEKIAEDFKIKMEKKEEAEEKEAMESQKK